MKIYEKKLKQGFLNILKKRKEERMLQYKFKDEFLQQLQSFFKDNNQLENCCDENLEIEDNSLTQQEGSKED